MSDSGKKYIIGATILIIVIASVLFFILKKNSDAITLNSNAIKINSDENQQNVAAISILTYKYNNDVVKYNDKIKIMNTKNPIDAKTLNNSDWQRYLTGQTLQNFGDPDVPGGSNNHPFWRIKKEIDPLQWHDDPFP